MTNEQSTGSNLGAAMAAVLAGAIGSAIFGVTTVLAAANAGIKEALNWWSPAGSLSGKAGFSVLVWLVVWVMLDRIWRNREPETKKLLVLCSALFGLAFVLVFPPVFEFFE